MKSNSLLLLLGVATLIVSGCSSVTGTHPLSRTPQAIDQEQFEGAWLADDKILHVMFSSNGVAKIAGVRWETNQFHILHGEMIVTEGDEHNFLSVRFQEDGKWKDNYTFLPYTFAEPNALVIWLPDADEFEKLIVGEQLQGTIEKGKYSTHVTITNAFPSLLKVMNDPRNLELFEYRKPIILKKIMEKN